MICQLDRRASRHSNINEPRCWYQVPTLGVAHSHEYCHISIVDAAVPCKDVVKVSTSSLFVRSVLNTTHLIQTSQITPLALTSGVERLRACNWGSKPSFNVQLFIVGE